MDLTHDLMAFGVVKRKRRPMSKGFGAAGSWFSQPAKRRRRLLRL